MIHRIDGTKQPETLKDCKIIRNEKLTGIMCSKCSYYNLLPSYYYNKLENELKYYDDTHKYGCTLYKLFIIVKHNYENVLHQKNFIFGL